MKQKNFLITSTEGHHVTKHTWNAASRHIYILVQELAYANDSNYTLTNSESIKEDYGHVYGTRVWTNNNDGSVVVFTIKEII